MIPHNFILFQIIDKQQFDELEFSMIQNVYSGVYDKLIDAYTGDEDTPMRWLYKQNEDNKVFDEKIDTMANEIAKVIYDAVQN